MPPVLLSRPLLSPVYVAAFCKETVTLESSPVTALPYKSSTVTPAVKVFAPATSAGGWVVKTSCAAAPELTLNELEVAVRALMPPGSAALAVKVQLPAWWR